MSCIHTTLTASEAAMQPSATPYLELAATLMFHSNPWNRYVYTIYLCKYVQKNQKNPVVNNILDVSVKGIFKTRSIYCEYEQQTRILLVMQCMLLYLATMCMMHAVQFN